LGINGNIEGREDDKVVVCGPERVSEVSSGEEACVGGELCIGEEACAGEEGSSDVEGEGSC